MGPGRILAIVVGTLLVLSGAAIFVSSATLGMFAKTRSDDAGFLNSPTYRITSPHYAVTSEEFEVAQRPGGWLPADIANVRIAAKPLGERPLFVGIGPAAEVARYLTGVAQATVVDLGARSSEIVLRQSEGGTPAAAPESQSFWVSSSRGRDTELIWDLRQGEWAIAIMNADGSIGIDADVTFAVRTPFLIPVALGLALLGAILTLIGALVLVAALRGSNSSPASVFTFDDAAYPAALYGEIDPDLSRWKWLVKWFLAIPHLIILGFLWTAYALLTVFAFVAILFTGRYPRSIFDFNVGVLRWTWRVGFYAFNPAATDQYPPFTLSAGSYVADLNVEYPERLSRGLVLVKWWLLAIPHYIIVGFFTGGLISILVLVAAVILLVMGRYPPSVFELLMGLCRWMLRVTAYATLMRDEYPPFRLDMAPNASPDGGGLVSPRAA